MTLLRSQIRLRWSSRTSGAGQAKFPLCEAEMWTVMVKDHERREATGSPPRKDLWPITTRAKILLTRRGRFYNSGARFCRQATKGGQLVFAKAFVTPAFILAALSVTVGASAQPTTIQPFGNGLIMNTPGQMPTTVQPFGSGAIMNTPGQMPTTIQPFGNGATINTPGEMPSTVQPFGNGAIMNTPGRMPTTIQPFGSGTITNTPGRAPVVCTPFGTGVICN